MNELLRWRYWIDGNGQWTNRWDSVGNDRLILATTIIAAALLTYECSRYALSYVPVDFGPHADAFRSHLMALRKIFLLSAIYHVTQLLVPWFVPAYYLITVAVFVMAYQVHLLNTDKLEQKSIVERETVEEENEGLRAELEKHIRRLGNTEE